MAKQSGMVGIWLEEHDVVEAARKTREAGFRKFDAITPCPVHGLEEAMGIKRSWIPWVTFIMGLTGATCGLLLQWWTSAVNWPINVGGKPFFSLPAFIPVIFEMTVLFAALSSVATLFIICRLPKINPVIIDPDLTSHKFGIFIPDNDMGYNEEKVSGLLKEFGAAEVKKVTGY